MVFNQNPYKYSAELVVLVLLVSLYCRHDVVRRSDHFVGLRFGIIIITIGGFYTYF